MALLVIPDDGAATRGPPSELLLAPSDGVSRITAPRTADSARTPDEDLTGASPELTRLLLQMVINALPSAAAEG